MRLCVDTLSSVATTAAHSGSLRACGPPWFQPPSMAPVSYTHLDVYKRQGVHTLPKELDEYVARLHLDALGVRLSQLTTEQADYLGCLLYTSRCV